MCAAFRGTYLDYRDKSDSINNANIKEHADKMYVSSLLAMFSGDLYDSSFEVRNGIVGLYGLVVRHFYKRIKFIVVCTLVFQLHDYFSAVYFP